MSLVDSVAQFSTAVSQAQVQAAVATRVLKISQDSQSQVAAALLGETVDNLEQVIEDFANNLGAQIDTYA